MPLEERSSASMSTVQIAPPPPGQGATKDTDPTISEDRTRGSTFEKNGEIWAALNTATQHAPTERLRVVGAEPRPRVPLPDANSSEGRSSSLSADPTPERYIRYWDESAYYPYYPGSPHAPYEPNEAYKHYNPFQPRSSLPVQGKAALRRARINGRIDSEYMVPQQSRVPGSSRFTAQQRTITEYQRGVKEQQDADGSSQPMPDLTMLLNKDSSTQQPDSDDNGQGLTSIAKLFGIPAEFATSLQAIQIYISELRGQSIQASPPLILDLRPLLIHRIHSQEIDAYQMFLDEPQWLQGADRLSGALKGSLPIFNIGAYLLRHPEVCFLICRDYATPSSIEVEKRENDKGPWITYHSEFIVPVEKHLAFAIKKFTHFSEPTSGTDAGWETDEYFHTFSDDWLENEASLTLSSPYLGVYHNRGDQLNKFCTSLIGPELKSFRIVIEYILQAYHNKYKAVDDITADGKITAAQLAYLFKPGQVLIEGEGKDARGFLCTSYLRETTNVIQRREKSYSIDAWHWDFSHGFVRTNTTLELDGIVSSDCAEIAINSLSFRPLEYVVNDTVQGLQRRGSWLWKCRKRYMVAYCTDKHDQFQRSTNERYIIDMETYHEIHSPGHVADGFPDLERDSIVLDEEALARDVPPDEDFVYLVPPSTKGFRLKTKKWCDIEIDRFEEVDWNTKAFQSLVLSEKTKRLIHALISNQIEAEMSTDIISGKGNGLIMLLHGGPGTGKTLTAESVAEIARKPLYPVTCGDMGTEPRDVEKYLESVLHLGKTWDCVVLLDEADVFLEQRSLEDLKRNALVSVLLRVLEYYDGILILTSNRVGMFDEAFKSRIQLAVHYTSLSARQRTKVWSNFFSRLKELNEEGIDFPDLDDHTEQLARHKMNGREIRNVITTARQYARWERKQQNGKQGILLDSKKMEEIIETSGKFDKYIAKLNNGLSQDELAEEDGLRLAGE